MKKSLSLVIEYMLLTFVVVLIVFQILNMSENLITKFKKKEQEKLFFDTCQQFSFFLKNMDQKGIFYFPIKVKFNNSKMIFKDYVCPLPYEFCQKEVFKEVIVVKKDNYVCFN